MNEIYKSMIVQQKLSEEAKAAFYEKLECARIKKQAKPVLRWAAIAACILLLIPVTVLAVENIFGIVLLNRSEQVIVNDQPGIGLEIRFDNVLPHPITAFSQRLQTLDQNSVFYYDSWEKAEEDLGISLLSNTVCTNENTVQVNYYTEEKSMLRKHCEGTYRCTDGQLYYAKISAAYQRDKVTFLVNAEITAEHPTVTQKQLQQYHGTSIAYYQSYDPNVTTKHYTTKNGIPTTVCTIDLGNLAEYTAYFAVNNISYEVRIVGSEGIYDDSVIYPVLCNVLDGFDIEKNGA